MGSKRCGRGLRVLLSVTCVVLFFSPATRGQDTGQIEIRLTVPEKIEAKVYASRPTPRGREVCIVSRGSEVFSVAALIGNIESLRPLRHAAATSVDDGCPQGMTVSVDARNSARITLIFSPE